MWVNGQDWNTEENKPNEEWKQNDENRDEKLWENEKDNRE